MPLKAFFQIIVLPIILALSWLRPMAMESPRPANLPAAIYQTDYMKESSAWLQSGNPAGLFFSMMPDMGQSYFFHSINNGSFYRPLEAEAVRQSGFYTERYQSLKQLRFRGHFNFMSINEKNRQLSNVNNPYSGNPYLLATETGGDWRRQHYTLGFGAVTGKLFEVMHFGLDVNYILQTGARQNDPRPLNNSNVLEIKPGFVFPLGKTSKIGFHGIYSNQNEEISISVSNSDEQQRWYRILGLAEYRTGYATGLFRAYAANTFGGAIQYAMELTNFSILAEASLKSFSEDATDGSSVMQHGGEFNQTSTEAKIHLFHNTAAGRHLLLGQLRMDQREGLEHNQSYDNTLERWVTFATTMRYRADHYSGSLQYSYYRTISPDNYRWMAGAKAGFVWDDARFLLPYSSQELQFFDFNIHGARIFKISSFQVRLNALAGYRLLADHSLNINPEVYNSGRTAIADKVLLPDQQFLTTDFIMSAAGFGLYRDIPQSASRLWINVQLTNHQPVGNSSFDSGRNFLELKLGLMY